MTISPISLKGIVPEVMGKALYLEFSPIVDAEGKTYSWHGKEARLQVLYMPNGVSSLGVATKPYSYHRVVSPHSPRSQWQSGVIEPVEADSEIKAQITAAGGAGHYLRAGIKQDVFDERTTSGQREVIANGVLLQLRNLATRTHNVYDGETREPVTTRIKEWELSKTFTVEVTDDDLVAVHTWKTPQGVIRRINKVLGR
tara:strand:+ start:1767 stop:2363 length:597 start_codon:yes stop_codon:yes gene_type:complete